MILMEPLISLCLVGPRRDYSAGEELIAEYQFDAVAADEIQAVESSVLWYTEGKGDEDLGVHFFERRVPSDADQGDLRTLRRFTSQLPSSPLTYAGQLFSVHWCVRVRLFLRRGRELVQEVPFVLGAVPGQSPE
ncbi:MAG: hypothetical protein WEH44_04860 [Pirellulaceae bacterium]